MKHNHSLFKRLISIILAGALSVSLLGGCGQSDKSEESVSASEPEITVDKEQIVETASNEIIEELGVQKTVSTNWEDYVGDLETFVYGLIVTELGYRYDVFPAYVKLLDGNDIFGIAYTDYEDCYVNADETQGCFKAGFIPYMGELAVPQDDFDAGLTLYNLDYSDTDYSFVLAYGSSPFTQHCVVYGKYLKYGVDEKGQIFYEAQDYIRGECDEDLGSLYSYDEAKYVYDIDVGEFVNLSGTSLYSQIRYEDLEAEINRILETQNTNIVTVDTDTCAYIAQEAVESYLLSLQEETFLGYDVNTLISEAGKLDPRECYRLTSEGLVTLDLQGGASNLTKWLVGTSCVIVVAVSMVGSVVTIACPPLSAASGAMAGTAIEIFMQVVISGESLEDVDWKKVAIAAATGAVSGFLGPYVYATTQGAAYFMLDSSLDGLVGGIERSIYAWMDGEEATEIIKSFGYGFALGFALSAGFKGAGAIVGKLGSKIGPGVKRFAERVCPNLTAKASALTAEFGTVIYGLKKAADSSVFHSKYISRKLAMRQLGRIVEDGSDELIKKSFDNLSKSDIVDANGELLSKDSLRKLFDEADDGAVLAYFKQGDELVQIVKKNGMVGIVFDPSKYQTVTLSDGIIDDRGINFEEAANILKEQWLDDPSLIPTSLAESIENSGIDLEDMEPEKLVDIIQKSDWVLHENIDLTTITLVPEAIHSVAEGGISHMGGFGLAKFLKSHMGFEFFERLISAASTGAVQSAN